MKQKIPRYEESKAKAKLQKQFPPKVLGYYFVENHSEVYLNETLKRTTSFSVGLRISI